MFKLYYFPNNANLAPHFLLYHVGADYELCKIDTRLNEHKSAEYMQLNPAGRIPTLVSEGQAIFESLAICVYICELHPTHALMPALGDKKRPLFYQWLSYLNNTLQAEIMVRYRPQRHTTDAACEKSVIAAQDERIAEALSIINHELEGQAYLLGDELTACDYFLFMLIGWLVPIDCPLHEYPRLAQYIKDFSDLPVVQAVCEIEGIELSAYRGYAF